MKDQLQAGRVSPPLPATHLAVGGEYFRNIVRDQIIPGLWQYRGYLLTRPDWRTDGIDAQNLIHRIQGFIAQPEKTEVRAKSPSNRVPVEHARNGVLFRSSMDDEWYEIAFNFPVITKENEEERLRSLELQPSKIRTTRRGGIGIDQYRAGLLVTELRDRVHMQGIHYEPDEETGGMDRKFTNLQPTIRRRVFRDVYAVVEETFHYLRHQPRHAPPS